MLLERVVVGVKDINPVLDPYKTSIFDEDGKLLPVLPKFLEPNLINKICVQNIILANFINNHPVMEQETKDEILQQLDAIYKSWKRMHLGIVKYKMRIKEEKNDPVQKVQGLSSLY